MDCPTNSIPRPGRVQLCDSIPSGDYYIHKMLRTAAVAAVLAASAEAFSTPALSGLRMQTGNAQISRKDILKIAGAGVLAAPALANAASIDPKTGFPKGGCLPGASSAETGCTPFTQAASVLDKQKAVLAGKITVGAGKADVLAAAVSGMKAVSSLFMAALLCISLAAAGASSCANIQPCALPCRACTARLPAQPNAPVSLLWSACFPVDASTAFAHAHRFVGIFK